jgi:hypothetical protein
VATVSRRGGGSRRSGQMIRRRSSGGCRRLAFLQCGPRTFSPFQINKAVGIGNCYIDTATSLMHFFFACAL